jgi:hypothetical protein
MRVPVPKNKLVAFTLVGALLTAGVAGALALPGGGLAQVGEQANSSDVSQQAASDAPTPNEEFTPAVQTQSGYEDEEHEDEEHEDEEHEDEEEHEEYEEEHEDE